jgi:hypothetical protein
MSGVELEGGWEHNDDADIKYDGSLSGLETNYVGEIVSDPYVRFGHLHNFIRNNYPDEVNSSCGFHIHYSGIDFERITKRSHDLFLRMCREYAKKRLADPTKQRAIRRLNGDNTYCEPHYDADVEDRYRAVNFRAYHDHGTVEIRLWPMPKHATTAIRIHQFTTAFVARHWGM